MSTVVQLFIKKKYILRILYHDFILSIFQFREIDIIVSVIVFFLESRDYHEYDKLKK